MSDERTNGNTASAAGAASAAGDASSPAGKPKMIRTWIYISEELSARIKNFRSADEDMDINVSKICSRALKDWLEKQEQTQAEQKKGNAPVTGPAVRPIVKDDDFPF